MAIKQHFYNLDIAARTLIRVALIYTGFVDTRYISNDVALRSCPVYTPADIDTCQKQVFF